MNKKDVPTIQGYVISIHFGSIRSPHPVEGIDLSARIASFRLLYSTVTRQ